MLKVIIAAAGKGTRSKLNYPKTLFKVEGVPILIRILRITNQFDKQPIIIADRKGKNAILDVLKEYGFSAKVIIQEVQLGMGDAVLQSEKYKNIHKAKNSLLLWGDLPFISSETLKDLVNLHKEENSDLSFPTLISDQPYTLVKRNENRDVTDLIELKNSLKKPTIGERDIGVFIYRTKVILEVLREIKNSVAPQSEIGFLNLVRILFEKGNRVKAFNIALKKEAISFNSIEDLENF